MRNFRTVNLQKLPTQFNNKKKKLYCNWKFWLQLISSAGIIAAIIFQKTQHDSIIKQANEQLVNANTQFEINRRMQLNMIKNDSILQSERLRMLYYPRFVEINQDGIGIYMKNIGFDANVYRISNSKDSYLKVHSYKPNYISKDGQLNIRCSNEEDKKNMNVYITIYYSDILGNKYLQVFSGNVNHINIGIPQIINND